MGEVVLSGNGLRKTYFRAGRGSARDFDAVSNVTIELVAGEVCALMGRSGSGKSTLLNMLSGLLRPDAGEVRLVDQDLYALDDRRLSRLRNARFGVVPQGHTALHSLTVMENVLLPSALYGGAAAAGRAEELLSQLGIAELANAYPSELSGGELRRVAIARALINEPQVLLADEPTSDLDDENTALVLGVMRRVADDGATVLLVTHEQSATGCADRVLRMDAGRLV